MSVTSPTRSPDPRTRVLGWLRSHRAVVDTVLAVGLWLLLGLMMLVSAVESLDSPLGSPLPPRPWASSTPPR